MNADEIRARIAEAKRDAEIEAAWVYEDEQVRAWRELDAGPRVSTRAVELRDRQPQVVVDEEKEAA